MMQKISNTAWVALSSLLHDSEHDLLVNAKLLVLEVLQANKMVRVYETQCTTGSLTSLSLCCR